MNYNIEGNLVADLSQTERAEFYRKTYTHVALAVLSFIFVEYALLNYFPDFVDNLMGLFFSNKFSWLIVLGLFWVGSTISDRMAHNSSKSTQYLGLGLYILLEALIFLPLIYMAIIKTGGFEVISQAGTVTIFLFGGLTAVVFMSNKDFSFLKTALVIGSFIAIGLIVAGTIFGFDLGLWFSVGMVILAAGAILYQTSQVKYEYGAEQYVGAALGIFASLMLLFWYILRIFMSRD